MLLLSGIPVTSFATKASNVEIYPEEQWQPLLGTAALNLV